MTQTLRAAEHLSPQQMSAFVDGELSAGELLKAEQHLAGCHECALRVLDETRLKSGTAAAAAQIAVPQDALARLAARLQQQEVPQKVVQVRSLHVGRWMVPAVALAACLLLAIALVGRQQAHQANTLSAELLDHHLAALSAGTAPEVISTDRHTVKPWFQGKLPFSFNLPEALPPDTTLQGGDLAYLDGHPAAMLLFTVHKHEVSVFLMQRSSRFPAMEQSGSRSGFAVHYAVTPELRIAAVSDVNPAELDRLVAAIVQAQ